MGRYVCTNLACLYDWHATPVCPYRRPGPARPITSSEIRTARYLMQRTRDGAFDSGPSLPRLRVSHAAGWCLVAVAVVLITAYLLFSILG